MTSQPQELWALWRHEVENFRKKFFFCVFLASRATVLHIAGPISPVLPILVRVGPNLLPYNRWRHRSLWAVSGWRNIFFKNRQKKKIFFFFYFLDQKIKKVGVSLHIFCVTMVPKCVFIFKIFFLNQVT